jgi:macrolide transport system ATP-binding/permease protein
MDSLMQWLRKLWIFARREKFERELNEEMAFHREQTAKEFKADGMAAELAECAARRQFGNAAHLQQRSHDVVAFGFETALQDFRFAIRQLHKNPGFATTAILIFTLGICASVSIFGFVDAALIKPLPYQNSSQLVGVYESAARIPRSNLSYLDYLDWKKRNRVFTSLEVWSGTGYLLKTSDGVQPAPSVRVSAGFFRTLGVNPVLGRDFDPGEDLPGAPRTAILSYATWRRWFGGREDVIGQTVTLSNISYTIVGVLPREFQFAPRGSADFWTVLDGSNSCETRRSCHNLFGIARLKDDVSVDMALAEMKSIAKQLEAEYPGSNRDQGAAVMPLSESIVGDLRPILLVLLAGAGLLLLIACVNVTSLLLARSESRKREIAVRGALGASFVRLVRQFATEGLVLVVAGGALGVIAAGSLMRLLTKLIPAQMLANMPYLNGLGLNYRVLAFACSVAVPAAVLFSVVPVLRASLLDMRGGLAEGGRGSAGRMWRRFGANLVVVELAIAVVLLAGAGLLGKSFYRLLHVELGFQPDHLATLGLAVPHTTYKSDELRVALARRVVSRVASLPGVKAVGLTTLMPVSFNGNTDWIRMVGKPFHGEHNEVNERDVSSDYFTALQAKLVHGRFFTDAEDASKPRVAVINETLAKEYFPGEDPIGKKFGDGDLTPNSLREIIGIVEDIREGPLDSKIWPAEYLPFNQSPDTFFALVVRTSQAEQSVLPTLSQAVRAIDPGIGIASEDTMIGRIDESQTAYLHRSSAWLVGGFAALALLLGVVGLYGVISYAVSQRTREIGVRMALGAPPRSVYQLILKDAGWLIAVGIASGLICAVMAATLMHKLLFGVESWDVPTLSGVALVLGLCALCAAFVPARRAASLDPVEVLRAE